VFLLSFSGSPWTLVSFVKQKKKQERQQANNVKIWTQKEAEKMRAQINNYLYNYFLEFV
jgi:uroporphyrinogen-III decarboxylase